MEWSGAEPYFSSRQCVTVLEHDECCTAAALHSACRCGRMLSHLFLHRSLAGSGALCEKISRWVILAQILIH